MAKKDGDKNFYVPLTSPGELRRDLLGNVKKVLILLKRYEKYKQLRQEKINYFHNLRITVKELETLNNKLSKSLPKTHLRALPKSKRKVIKAKSQEVEIEEKPAKKKIEGSTLHKLEAEIEEIESKIRELE